LHDKTAIITKDRLHSKKDMRKWLQSVSPFNRHSFGSPPFYRKSTTKTAQYEHKK